MKPFPCDICGVPNKHLLNEARPDGTILRACPDCYSGAAMQVRPRGRFRPEALDLWVAPVKVDGRWHLYESGQRKAVTVACGLVFAARGQQSRVSGHWPEYACGPCIGIVRETRKRLTRYEAKREPDVMERLVDAIVGDRPNP